MRTFVLSFVAAGAALAAAPAAAQGHPAPSAGRTHDVSQRDPTAIMLRARLASINLRIETLRRADALDSEEARELRNLSRRLEIQLYGLSRREAEDLKHRIGRLESRLRFAADDARWGGRASKHELDRRYGDPDPYERFDRYQADRSGHYRNFDRYTGSSVDRWHDPFDRGN
jgi:hypothetical protein